MSSLAAPPGRENARERRRRMRKEAAIVREGDALQHIAGGLTYAEIAAELHVAVSTAYRLVHRGLERRAATEGPAVEVARALYLARIELLFGAWMPRAIGKGLDANLQPTPPNPDAAKIVLGLLDRYADVTGVRAPVQLDLGDAEMTPAAAILAVMESLDRVVDKQRVIAGELATAGTDLHRAAHGDDKVPPPTIPDKPRKAAAK